MGYSREQRVIRKKNKKNEKNAKILGFSGRKRVLMGGNDDSMGSEILRLLGGGESIYSVYLRTFRTKVTVSYDIREINSLHNIVKIL